MESWPGQEKRVQVVLTARLMATRELPAKRIQRERPLKVSQLSEPRQVSEKWPEQAKLAGLETAPVV